MRAKHKKAFARWRRWTSTLQGAIQWSKLRAPPCFAVRTDAGSCAVGRHGVLSALHDWWGALFQQRGRKSAQDRIQAYEAKD
eukprot:729037-Alexandrium_andersonii.AAC.1